MLQATLARFLPILPGRGELAAEVKDPRSHRGSVADRAEENLTQGPPFKITNLGFFYPNCPQSWGRGEVIDKNRKVFY